VRVHVKFRDRRLVLHRDKACAYCGKLVASVTQDDAPYAKRWKAYDAEGNVFHFEHVIPLVAGGPNDESNIVLACRECNLKKARKERTARACRGELAMSKMIKVDDKTYGELDHLRLGRQTFADVISRLLESRLKVLEMFSVLEGQLGYREYQREKLDKISKTV